MWLFWSHHRNEHGGVASVDRKNARVKVGGRFVCMRARIVGSWSVRGGIAGAQISDVTRLGLDMILMVVFFLTFLSVGYRRCSRFINIK
jgi:hypothetical protein